MHYLILSSHIGPILIEFISHDHHNQPCTDMCMSIEATGVLKRPSSTEKARIDWRHWSDSRLLNRRIEVKRLIHFFETRRLEYSLFKKQVMEYELECIDEVIDTRRQANDEIKRQMLESELEVLNAEIRAKDSPTPRASTPQASTHRSLIVNCVHMPQTGPMDTGRVMGSGMCTRQSSDRKTERSLGR